MTWKKLRWNNTKRIILLLRLFKKGNLFLEGDAIATMETPLKYVLLLDWCYNAKPCTKIKHHVFLRQVNILLDGGKTLLWLTLKREGSISSSDFDGQLSDVLVTSCVCLTFHVVIFRFLLCASWSCCWGVSLLDRWSPDMLFIYSSALIFRWIDIIPVLKKNGINKKPSDVYMDFQVTIVNAPKSLKGWFSRI